MPVSIDVIELEHKVLEISLEINILYCNLYYLHPLLSNQDKCYDDISFINVKSDGASERTSDSQMVRLQGTEIEFYLNIFTGSELTTGSREK